MAEPDAGLSDAERVQTDANLGLAVRFFEEYLRDPDGVGGVPVGSAVVLLPPEDPVLSVANRAMAERLSAQGRDVRFVRVRTAAAPNRSAASGRAE